MQSDQIPLRSLTSRTSTHTIETPSKISAAQAKEYLLKSESMKKQKKISLANTPHLWDVLLKKLSTFVENRPSENALLCKILL